MPAESEVNCPFCGETIMIIIDTSVGEQTYVEDCSVCCRPILFTVRCSDDQLDSVAVDRS